MVKISNNKIETLSTSIIFRMERSKRYVFKIRFRLPQSLLIFMPMTKCFPNTFIAGVPKGGTTALASIISQHPEVFIPEKKEPRYFIYKGQSLDTSDKVNKGVVTDETEYISMYEGAKEPIIIDGTPGYFSSPDAIKAIAQASPNAKIILLLRDPIERAFSHLIFSIKMGYELPNTTMKDVLNSDMVTLKNGFQRKRPYLVDGHYDDYLKIVFDHFSKENVFIRTSEQFQKEQSATLNEITRFLGVTEFSFNLNVGEFAKSGVPQNQALHNALNKGGFLKHILPTGLVNYLKNKRRTIQNNNLKKPELDNETRALLIDYFKPHITKLKELSDINISYWKNFS